MSTPPWVHFNFFQPEDLTNCSRLMKILGMNYAKHFKMLLNGDYQTVSERNCILTIHTLSTFGFVLLLTMRHTRENTFKNVSEISFVIYLFKIRINVLTFTHLS